MLERLIDLVLQKIKAPVANPRPDEVSPKTFLEFAGADAAKCTRAFLERCSIERSTDGVAEVSVQTVQSSGKPATSSV